MVLVLLVFGFEFVQKSVDARTNPAFMIASQQVHSPRPRELEGGKGKKKLDAPGAPVNIIACAAP